MPIGSLKEGDPRGDFISLQIQLAEMSPFDPDFPSIDAQIQRLISQHAASWLAFILASAPLDPDEFNRMELDKWNNAQFENGFLQQIAMTPDVAASQWHQFCHLEPLQGVELVVHEDIPSVLAESDVPSTWRSLKVSPNGWLTFFSVRGILFWDLKHLESLDLSGCDLGVDGARLLANQPVEMADLDGPRIPPHPLNHAQLHSLSVRNSSISDEGLAILLSPKAIHGLKQLDISQCRLTDASSLLHALAPLKQLEDLRLAGNNALDLNPLKGWKQLQQLHRLSLPQSLEPEGFSQLFPAPSSSMHALDIASAKALLVRTEIVAAAAENLVQLNIGATSAGDGSFRELMSAASTAKLNTLQAYRCSLSDKAVDALVQRPDSYLVQLDLSSNKLSDASLRLLAEWPGLNNLAQLRLGNNRKLSAAGYTALIESEAFAPAVLDIGACKDKKLIDALVERFPHAIRWKS